MNEPVYSGGSGRIPDITDCPNRRLLDELLFFERGTAEPRFLFGENANRRPLKLRLDDLRVPPAGYHGCKSVLEARLCIRTAEKYKIPIEVIDRGHDPGVCAKSGGDGIKLPDFLVERERFYPIALH